MQERPMNPPRLFRRLVPGVAVVALLATAARPAEALDPPAAGSLRSREFLAPDLIVSSSHVALGDALARLPNRAAWERGRSARAASGGQAVHVFVDPRSGAATNIMAPFPLLPGNGVGNLVSRASLGALLGREIPRVDPTVVAEAARLFVLEHAGVLGIDPALGRQLWLPRDRGGDLP
jgi:trimeric autotransporter adhesin